jgi:hypothetical protein
MLPVRRSTEVITTVIHTCVCAHTHTHNLPLFPLSFLGSEYVLEWIPCHHDIVCPQIVHGGDFLQAWKTAASMLINYVLEPTTFYVVSS